MSPGAASLYVYYRVRPVDAPPLIAAAQALHARWRSELPGLVCTLSQRAEDGTPHLTLMESYSHPEGLSPHWQQVLEAGAAHALAPWIVGPRHLERFVPCA